MCSVGEDQETQRFYKWCGTRCTGTPPCAVVSSVSLGAYANDPETRIIDYDYDLALLDQSTTLLRCGRVSASTPHFAGEPSDGYHLARFYNDMDDDDFTSVDSLPDLDDGGTFRIEHGGYLLDGMVYLSYDSSAVDTGNALFDYSRNEYILSQFSTLQDGLYRRLLTHTETRVDGSVSDLYYMYDRKGRLLGTQRPLYDNLTLQKNVIYDDT